MYGGRSFISTFISLVCVYIIKSSSSCKCDDIWDDFQDINKSLYMNLTKRVGDPNNRLEDFLQSFGFERGSEQLLQAGAMENDQAAGEI